MFLISGSSVSGPVKGVFQFIDNFASPEVDIRLYGFKSKEIDKGHFYFTAKERGYKVYFLVQHKRSYLSLIRQTVPRG